MSGDCIARTILVRAGSITVHRRFTSLTPTARRSSAHVLAAAPGRPAAHRLCSPRPRSPAPTEDERARNAVRVLTDIQEIPESAIPDKLLDEARAIVDRPRHDQGRTGARRPPRPRRAVGQEPRRHLVEPELRHPHRRQHRLPGRRAVGRRRAGVPQRPRAGLDRQRQDHPRRRCRRRRRPDRAQRLDRHRRPAQGGDLVVVARPRPVRRRRPGRRGAVDRRRRQRGRLRPRHHPADDLRGPRQRPALERGRRFPRPARGSHRQRPRQPQRQPGAGRQRAPPPRRPRRHRHDQPGGAGRRPAPRPASSSNRSTRTPPPPNRCHPCPEHRGGCGRPSLRRAVTPPALSCRPLTQGRRTWAVSVSGTG